jgi:hypothetical protein
MTEIQRNIVEEKAKFLLAKHGFEKADTVVDAMLDESLPNFNQIRVDFWLDVKNELKKQNNG